MEQNYPLKPRYYQAIEELISEDERDISFGAMHRRCTGIRLLLEYNNLPATPQLMPSADATLQGLVLTIPGYAFEGDQNPIRKVYQDLFLKLPDYVTFYIITHAHIAAPLQAWLQQNGLQARVNLHIVPERYQMTIWAEDSFELVQDKSNGQLYLMQPHSHRRTSEGNIGYQAGKAFGWVQAKTPLYFEGGNLLVGDDFMLLGVDHAIDTYNYLSSDLVQDRQAIGKTIAQLYQQYLDTSRHLYFVGCAMQLPAQQEQTFVMQGEEWTEVINLKNGEGTMQPIFHIDMFITLAGRNSAGNYQLVVGDTRLAAELLGQPELQLVAPDAFDEVAENLQRMGFDVIRNPLPLVYVDDPAQKLRKWYFASYNNALVEIRPDGRRTIWMPTYGHGNWPELEKTDQENKRIWEELGFKVIMLKDFNPFAENAGAAHCIKKYIRG